jgi:hypothetical protein
MQVREADLHTRQPPTRSGIYQMMYWYDWFSWWWALGCLKRVEKWNKHIKESVSSCLLTRIVPRCTVNKIKDMKLFLVLKTFLHHVVFYNYYGVFFFSWFHTTIHQSTSSIWLLVLITAQFFYFIECRNVKIHSNCYMEKYLLDSWWLCLH